MERRHYQRHPVSTPINLFVQGQLLAVAEALEMSPAGICIANSGVKLRPQQLVTLNFCGADRTCLTHAMVIYKNAHRIGLMFADNIPRRCLTPSEQMKGCELKIINNK